MKKHKLLKRSKSTAPDSRYNIPAIGRYNAINNFSRFDFSSWLFIWSIEENARSHFSFSKVTVTVVKHISGPALYVLVKNRIFNIIEGQLMVFHTSNDLFKCFLWKGG